MGGPHLGGMRWTGDGVLSRALWQPPGRRSRRPRSRSRGPRQRRRDPVDRRHLRTGDADRRPCRGIRRQTESRRAARGHRRARPAQCRARPPRCRTHDDDAAVAGRGRDGAPEGRAARKGCCWHDSPRRSQATPPGPATPPWPQSQPHSPRSGDGARTRPAGTRIMLRRATAWSAAAVLIPLAGETLPRSLLRLWTPRRRRHPRRPRGGSDAARSHGRPPARRRRRRRTGIGAFNVIHLETAEAIAAAAETPACPSSCRSPRTASRYHGGLEPIARATLAVAAASSAAVAVHLDHAEDEELARQAIDLGFGSVMYDGAEARLRRRTSRRPRRVVDRARTRRRVRRSRARRDRRQGRRPRPRRAHRPGRGARLRRGDRRRCARGGRRLLARDDRAHRAASTSSSSRRLARRCARAARAARLVGGPG